MVLYSSCQLYDISLPTLSIQKCGLVAVVGGGLLYIPSRVTLCVEVSLMSCSGFLGLYDTQYQYVGILAFHLHFSILQMSVLRCKTVDRFNIVPFVLYLTPPTTCYTRTPSWRYNEVNEVIKLVNPNGWHQSNQTTSQLATPERITQSSCNEPYGRTSVC